MIKKIIVIHIFSFVFLGCSGISQDQENLEFLQNEKVERCLSLQGSDSVKNFGYLIRDSSESDNSGQWLPIDSIQEKMKGKIMMELSFRENDSVRVIILENFSLARDWYRIDFYCFDSEGRTVELYSDLRTFQSEEGVQVLRTWTYDHAGEILKMDKEMRSLKSKETLSLDTGFFDHPPEQVTTVHELFKLLKFSEI